MPVRGEVRLALVVSMSVDVRNHEGPPGARSPGPAIAWASYVPNLLRRTGAAIGRDGRLLLTLGETASRLGTGPLGIERLVEEGLLVPIDHDGLGRTWFDPADVDDVASGAAARRRESQPPKESRTMAIAARDGMPDGIDEALSDDGSGDLDEPLAENDDAIDEPPLSAS